ncbi:MAG: putative transcriptional regulator [Roseibaca calidilacus]|uniref:MerR HTH family regulatory protein n=1 Tax=Roseibaca calidilacus TaxID=1666912 RepID=A0A0P7X5D2_9RHOB|nr:MerR family transcriptional regulator [Roseibaca calidilacus]KPP95755.1 MAG: putative transcriptional regulator [Roseibaca calidilacus]CUX81761.1 MerR HTH family regulatory protein [Roseibaca calidilacus]
MRKAPEAFRTISEAAEALDTPAHVLRFWESKFTHVKPVKRAGGRRYYRPADIDLLSGIKLLLHDQGMTIRGVQKLLQEKGARHVAGLAPISADVLELPLDPPADMGTVMVPKPDIAPDLPPAVDTTKVESVRPVAEQGAQPLPESSDTPEEVPEEPALPPQDDQTGPIGDSAGNIAEPRSPRDTAPEPDLPDAAAPAPDATAAAPEQDAGAELTPDAVQSASEQAEEAVPPTPTKAPAPVMAPVPDTDPAPPEPARFARIAHALRVNPPRDVSRFAPALSRLEQLARTLAERSD